MTFWAQHASYRQSELIWRWNGEDTSQFETVTRAWMDGTWPTFTNPHQVAMTVVDSPTGGPHKKKLRIQRTNTVGAGLVTLTCILLKEDQIPAFEDEKRRLIIEVNGDSWDLTGATGNNYPCGFVIGDTFGEHPLNFTGYALSGLGQCFRIEEREARRGTNFNWAYTQNGLVQFFVEGRAGSDIDPFGDFPHFQLFGSQVTNAGGTSNHDMVNIRNTYNASDGDWNISGGLPDVVAPEQWAGNQFNRIGIGLHSTGIPALYWDMLDMKIYKY